MDQSKEFSGKRALVTGATKGIGRAIADLLHAMGATLVASGRDAGELAALERELGAETHAVDFRDPQAVKAFAQGLGPVDLVVNNAGMSIMEPVLEATIEAFHDQMNVNALATLIVTQQAAKGMIERGVKGAIVNVSSVSSTIAFPDHASYCASKGAVDALTTVMALELGRHGIRVNAVNPTVVMTKMAAKAWSRPEKAGPLLSRIPMGRFIEPAEVASAVAYLLGERSSMITGVTLPVDGGLLIAGGKA